MMTTEYGDSVLIRVARDVAKRTRQLGHDLWKIDDLRFAQTLWTVADGLDLRANEWERLAREAETSDN